MFLGLLAATVTGSVIAAIWLLYAHYPLWWAEHVNPERPKL
jgi:hypothetical protein